MRKTYGLKGYSDSCPMYLATIGGWRLCLQSTSFTANLPTPYIPSPHFCEDIFVEGNHKSLKFLAIKRKGIPGDDPLFGVHTPCTLMPEKAGQTHHDEYLAHSPSSNW